MASSTGHVERRVPMIIRTHVRPGTEEQPDDLGAVAIYGSEQRCVPNDVTTVHVCPRPDE